MSGADDRQARRLQVLVAIAELAQYRLEQFVHPTALFTRLVTSPQQEIIDDVLYLHAKGYLIATTLEAMGMPVRFAQVKLTSDGIDLAERIEQGRNLDKYDEDFSRKSLIIVQNLHNSQVNVQSPGSSNTQTGADFQSLKDFFTALKNHPDTSEVAKALCETAVEELQTAKPSIELLKGVGRTIWNLKLSIIGNLLTPAVAQLLGLPPQ